MKTYPLFCVHVPIEEALANIRVVFESGFINEGTQVTQLTEAMRDKLGAQNLLLTNSCTSALTLALHLAGIDSNSEVITTPMTCVATNTPIVASGAKLVWADVNPESGMLTVETIKAKLTYNTKAVMIVAWAGTPPDLSGILNFCRERDIKLILDAAHAFGALYEGVPIHQWADFTCYSFQAIKHITTGDGGALVCDDDEAFVRAKALKWFGIDRDRAKDSRGDWKGQQWDVDIEETGYKFNMNNVSAAIGLSQLAYVDKIVDAHYNNATLYDIMFKDCDLVYHAARPVGSTSAFWVYTALLSPGTISRDELLHRLNAEGIMAGVVHVPNDDYAAFDSFRADLPGVRSFSQRQFSLPCGWWLSDHDIMHIASRVKELVSIK